MDRDRAGSEEEVALRQQTDSQREREKTLSGSTTEKKQGSKKSGALDSDY